MDDHQQWRKRQQVLANFGEFALRNESLDDVLTEACRLVGGALGTQRSKILEIDDREQTLLVRAGVGWGDGVVGKVRLAMGELSSETFSIKAGAPVISQDVRVDKRFELPAFMKASGVVALVNVPIFLPGGTPFGLLQVDSREPREFEQDDIEFLRTYAALLGPVIDRLDKVRALRAAEERFRLIVEAARDYAIFTTDANDRIVDWLPGAEAVFGWSAAEARGRSANMLFTPQDRAAGEDVKEAETARRTGFAPNVRWHVHKDGSRVFIEGSVTSVRGADGQTHGFLKIGQDVTERRRNEERIRASEARQRALIEGIPQLVWQADIDGRWTWSSPQWSDFTGLPREQSLAFGWLSAVHPDDRTVALDAWTQANQTGSFETEYRIRHGHSATYRWFAIRAAPVRDHSGGVLTWLGTSTDIDDLRRLQQRQEVMVTELQHRTRNLIAVVQSIASQTMATCRTMEEFRLQFHERLAALARVQGLLSRAAQEPITIAALVRVALDALGAFDRSRATISGPDVPLRNSSVQTLALALHELATNARKYGALSVSDGRLDVTWQVRRLAAGRHVELAWIEHGRGPERADRPDPRNHGYGRKLIERALPYALSATTTFELRDNGVRCTISLPFDPAERTQPL
ncbi:PAS domain S-box-containing protein [Rhodopseudomonas thermotolerans]|uniref:Blue-light-activated histidine kinase n=2 Tax=Rhodopseudomonas TaxID=1073 RepID=A0A336JNJ3_9BRAD|nr:MULTISPECIES: PAS domain S-box protein [Rhodopseudomonas]RED34491.1 PAS domain S-box-containing protein [Rhodopseudomonas pentothenatexigens]REG02687.1 PAS domain S-box-containing protein [Rhodopseudomonas thermotolerans]SSW91160.1 PAS domain S-box-containing protein [Rhodopseudomonas pentothenatexigens]